MRKFFHQSRQSLHNLTLASSNPEANIGGFESQHSIRDWFALKSSKPSSISIPNRAPSSQPPQLHGEKLHPVPLPLQIAPDLLTTSPAEWTLPIPPELMFLVIDQYLSDDTKAMARLSMTSRVLVPYCRKRVFRSVKIYIRERHRGDKPLHADLFKASVEGNPALLDLVHDLQIHDRGPFVYQIYHSITEEEISLCSLLAIQMKNLARFEFNSNMTWSRLPGPLQEALCTFFLSPTLTELSLHGVAIPINLLHLVKNLKVVDIRAEGVGAPISHPQSSSLLASRVEVDTLKLRDRNLFGSTVHRVLEEKSPFFLPQLRHLEVCLPGKWVQSIQRPLQFCMSLTCLKVFVGTAGGVPAGLDLSYLRALKSLTLSTDISMMSVGSNRSLESIVRFCWLVGALCTIVQPCKIEDVTFIIRTGSLEQGKQCDWDLIDVLFVDAKSWPALRSLEIIWCTGSHLDIQQNHNDAFVNELPVLLPNLSERSISKMRTTYSDTCYNFWTYS